MAQLLSPGAVQVFNPTTLRELASLLKERPGLFLVAGATSLMRQRLTWSAENLPQALVNLTEIEDLKKIRRKEASLEIGACVTLERLIALGPELIHPLLLQALRLCATPSVRNMATLGGAVMSASPLSDILLPLLLLDAKLEVRRLNSHYWLPLSRLLKEAGRPALSPVEFIAHISLPLASLRLWRYERLPPVSRPVFSACRFAAAASVVRDTITDFRMAIAGVSPLFIRNREFEAQVIGLKVPFSPKRQKQLEDYLRDFFKEVEPSFLPEPYHRAACQRLACDFLHKTSGWLERF